VLHNTLDFRGGADAVCLHACAALARDHEVTLFTVSETTLAEVASYFGLDADPATVAVDFAREVDVRSPPASAWIARGLSTAAPWIGPQLAARSALLARYARPRLSEFDLAVSTTNELSLPIPSVQYVHVPQFTPELVPGGEAGRLDRLWRALAAPPRWDGDDGSSERTRGSCWEETTLLTNSAWTADVVASIYGRRPAVVHPPVDPIPGEPWDRRENGVVFAGRLAPDKRALAAIDVVDRARDRGADLHLHVVGSAPRAYRRYARRVASAAAGRPYVHLERDVPRDRLERLLAGHRFGLTAKEHEHFGMALAEYVAAGMVAFAPDSGGQRDVLDGRADRLYGSIEEAATLLARAARRGDPPRQQQDRFASDRFRRHVREHVADTLRAHAPAILRERE
ncbi:MAG: glycosyltransferase, partial [Haloferacaceae archaeon]